ncbi:hypothetical protein SH1V18_22010 [Vallitalea longa]|uniref:DUF2812 domain-containing protein n=1 Tax=Vallitalea longa TaxID=2936439 RepID=A0A9W5YBP3_9FIRM|nr:DUF2812 domain-containing protein [Vallitalea longa]GKX29721.1 hypothetical protein SH1V18_22010 [Vallitalea longa]
MSKDTKKVVRVTSITEYKTLEKYLEKKAAMGLMLSEIKKNILIFKKVTPRNLTFNVSLFYPSTPFDYPDYEEEKYYRELCEDSGWKYCASNEIYQIFYKEENIDVVPIHTDSREEYRIIKNIFLKTEFIAMLCIVLMLAMSFNQAMGFDYSDLFSNRTLFVIISPIFLLVIGLLLYVPSIIWFIRNKINISRGNELDFISYRGRLVLTTISWSMIAVYLMCAIFGITDGYKNIKGIIALIPAIISFIVGRYCYRRIKTKKNTRKHNIIFVLTVVIITTIIITASFTMSIMFTIGSFNGNDFIPEKIAVLELSDFGISDVPQRLRSHQKSSILVPEYLEYYESLGRKTEENEITSIRTTYIKCRNKSIADYVFDGYVEKQKKRLEKRISEYREYGDIEKAKAEEKSISKVYNDSWEADRGYYLSDNNSEIIFQNDNIIYILESDIDFSKAKIVNICEQKLNQ